jgi:small subunit ribosomal protein S17
MTANKTPHEAVRKEFIGTVVSDAMDKSIVIRVERPKMHPRYHKVMRRSKKLHVHDEKNDAHVGDTVRVVACRPMSKSKTWRLVAVTERAK